MKGYLLLSALACALISAVPAQAEKKYDPGVTDTTIKVGQTMPYSGPASAYGQIGRAEVAYIKMINDEGGINGRKIEIISLDDGYSPPKTVEAVRRLVEQDGVFILFSTLGTAPNSAVQRYLNDKKIPQLLVSSGASKFNDPKKFPWTTPGTPNYQTEAHLYAQQILMTKPAAKIAVLYQNDDLGKDYLKGLKEGLGDKAKLIVAEQSYETSDPTIESQIVSLKASGADVLMNFATPKFAAQAIRKVAELGWKPDQYLGVVSASVGAVLTPAGLDNSIGVITLLFAKDATDKTWDNDEGMKAFRGFMKKYLPEANVSDAFNSYGYGQAQLLVYVLKQCGDELTRENVMKYATSIKDFELPLSLPGVKINTSADDYDGVRSAQLARFDGKTWARFGDVLSKK
jgi:branched-chain amino acid transport system substrate-binding protein